MRDIKVESPAVVFTAATSLRIIAAAVIFAFIYYASSVLITLVFALFAAFVLDPGVSLMERFRIPRWVGSLLMGLLALAGIYVVMYLVYDRAVAFFNQLPQFVVPIQRIIVQVEAWARNLWQNTTGALPRAPEASGPTARLLQGSQWMQYLAHSFRSVYAFTVDVMFIPFLVFFILTSKDRLWASTLNLFSVEQRQHAEDVIAGIAHMARRYVVGNLLVALISAGALIPVFIAIGLPYALVVGPISAFLTLVPYLGVALSLGPPLLIGVVQYHRATPFVVMTVAVVVVHFLATNLLTPKLVGHSVRLNPLTVTIAMMFWGWLWGTVGLVLAVPLTAAIKAVCDNIPSLQAYGAWMGEG